MPCYNAAPWLGQAIESVLQQTLPAWELLIVDDGSTDGSQALALEYAARDPRIHALPNERARGAGGARNTGLEHARGEAVMFLDSDDAFFPEAVEAMHGGLAHKGAPALRGVGAIFCHQRWLSVFTYIYAIHCIPTEYGPMMFPPRDFCNHIYTRAFLLENGVRFAEDMPWNEDRLFICHVYALLKHIPLLNNQVILYRINHKRVEYSARRARLFAEGTRRICDLFARYGRGSWITPYIIQVFFAEWLSHFYAAQQEGAEQALRFVERCRGLFAGREHELLPALRVSLGQAADEFCALSAGDDSAGMLALLQRNGAVRPPAVYIGLEKNPGLPGWWPYILARRAANLTRPAHSAKAILYFTQLWLRHRRRMLAQPQSGGLS